MNDKQVDDTIRRYLETGTPEEQKEFAEALLSSQKKINDPTPSIPAATIRASRFLFVVLAAFIVISLGRREELVKLLPLLVLLGAMAWFPNEIAAATGRIGFRTAVSRPSHPWILFVLVWLFLLLFGLAAASRWGAA